MRRPVLAVMTGLTALVVGLGIRSGAHHTSVTTTLGAPVGVVAAGPSPSATPDATASASPRATPGASPRPTPSPTRAAAKRVNGAAADTRYGPVQVQITVRGGRITAADAIEYPRQSGRDQEINSYAIPQLDDETVQAQSASIDSVSGATYTSDGYVSSLQSAIDQAHAAGLL